MRMAQVRAHCLRKPGAALDNPWGEADSVVKVGGKIFCFVGDPKSISVKNTPAAIEEWRARFPEHIGSAPYLKKTLWSRVTLAGMADDDIRELIDDSYDLVVAGLPRRLRPVPR